MMATYITARMRLAAVNWHLIAKFLLNLHLDTVDKILLEIRDPNS